MGSRISKVKPEARFPPTYSLPTCITQIKPHTESRDFPWYRKEQGFGSRPRGRGPCTPGSRIVMLWPDLLHVHLSHGL